MKLSKAKVTYPGRKQVYRLEDNRGRFIKDILGLEGEKISGRTLLKKVMSGGRLINKPPVLSRIRKYRADTLSRFPAGLKEVYPRYKYPLVISPGLKELSKRLSRQLEKKQ
jgi:nicotinate phosphoribosyltransferase